MHCVNKSKRGVRRWRQSGERKHGPHITRTEVISLTIFDGPLTVA
jgi:hypothetical protein